MEVYGQNLLGENKLLNENNKNIFKKKVSEKYKKKKLRLKERKKTQRELATKNNERPPKDNLDVEIVYVDPTIEITDEKYKEYTDVFEKFKGVNVVKLDDTTMKYIDGAYQLLEKEFQEEEEKKKKAEKERKREEEEELNGQKLDEHGQPKLSKKKLRKLSRLSVAELKGNVDRPDLVEIWDVNSKDPMLLIHLKSYRNTVPIPIHWSQKRKYLQAKRGLEKSTYELPTYVADTGIAEMRAALSEKEEALGIKGKAREKVRPKLGKLEIDYQKLHDAFFKYQTKPKVTIHGDLYYENKEYEISMLERKPGELSEELKTALGIPLTPEGRLVPPPWLIQMQRHGPPPSYPSLRIRGLNAPIPSGAQFGYHPGGWGKPPVDINGIPLYGDVFGTETQKGGPTEINIDKVTMWGTLHELSDESSEEASSEEETEDDGSGIQTESGLETPSGMSSVPAGMETPDHLELRKKKQIEDEMDKTEFQALYSVLPEKKTENKKGIMAPSFTYDLTATKVKNSGVDVALDPSELEDESAIRLRYETKLKEQSEASGHEDLSDMVAAHAAQQNQKRKKKQEKEKITKKYKDVF